jgi:hypothetical protein
MVIESDATKVFMVYQKNIDEQHGQGVVIIHGITSEPLFYHVKYSY